MSSARRKDLAMVAIGLLVILVDQLTKRWIVAYFASGEKPAIPLLGHVLELQYVQNTGVAFSLLENSNIKFAFILIAIGVIAALYWRTRATASLLLKVTFGLVLGGAVGNLIDRFTRQYVVDFIHFQIPGVFNFAVFNVADSCIVVGVLLLAFLLWRQSGEAQTPAAPAQEPPAAHQRAAREAVGEVSAPLSPRVRRRITSER